MAVPSLRACAERDCRRRQGHVRRGAARRDRRGGEPGADREDPRRRRPTARAGTRSSICGPASTPSRSTLPGFSTVKRDGVELPTNFTATINADLRVGALEETVTVSGQSPVVDVQNAVQQTVLSAAGARRGADRPQHPDARRLLPGARLALPDVGGTSGMQNRDLTVHGSDGRDTTFQVDGMTLNGIEGDGSVQSYFNDMMFEEVSYQTSAINAEVSAGGVRANMIPKDGGNTFKGTHVLLRRATRACRADNSDDAQGARAGGARRAQQGVGLQRRRRRTDQEGQAVVLRLRIATGASISTSPTASFDGTASRPSTMPASAAAWCA